MSQLTFQLIFAYLHRYVHYRDIGHQHSSLRHRHDDSDAIPEIFLYIRRIRYTVSLYLRNHVLRQLSSIRRETISSEKRGLLLPAATQLAT